MIIKNNTPIESYEIGNRTVYVKREDLCCNPVSFSKVRGIYAHLKKRPEKYIGVLDTFHSKAGWGVSIIGRELKKKVVVYYPEYKGEIQPRVLQRKCREAGASIVPLKAGRSCILYHEAKNRLKHSYGSEGYMMPNALQIPESIEENCMEAYNYTPRRFWNDTVIIISISSGTIAAGVLRGFYLRNANVKFYIHMGYSRSIEAVNKKFKNIIRPSITSLGRSNVKFEIIDEEYDYKDFVKYPCPFPCNPYYDLKAWNWLNENISLFPKDKKILFWNIGA